MSKLKHKHSRSWIWVSPRGGRWKVHREKGRELGIFDTKREAFQFAREIARKRRTELVVQNRNGRISDRRSYGKDKYPPKG